MNSSASNNVSPGLSWVASGWAGGAVSGISVIALSLSDIASSIFCFASSVALATALCVSDTDSCICSLAPSVAFSVPSVALATALCVSDTDSCICSLAPAIALSVAFSISVAIFFICWKAWEEAVLFENSFAFSVDVVIDSEALLTDSVISERPSLVAVSTVSKVFSIISFSTVWAYTNWGIDVINIPNVKNKITKKARLLFIVF